MCRKRPGITKIELVVLIVVIAVLVGLLLPAMQKVRETTWRDIARWQIRDIGYAVHNYYDAHKKFPPANGPTSANANNNFPLSIHLLPYVEQAPLYEQYATKRDPNRETVPLIIIPPFSISSGVDLTTSDSIGVQNFAGNVRVFTLIGVETKFASPVIGLDASKGLNQTTLTETFTDGTSNTIMFATRFANSGKVSGDGKVNCSAYDAPLGLDNSAFFGVRPLIGKVSANSTGGWQQAPSLEQTNCQFGAVAHSIEKRLLVSMADCSTRSIDPNISSYVWNTAMQPNDGQPVSSDW